MLLWIFLSPGSCFLEVGGAHPHPWNFGIQIALQLFSHLQLRIGIPTGSMASHWTDCLSWFWFSVLLKNTLTCGVGFELPTLQDYPHLLSHNQSSRVNSSNKHCVLCCKKTKACLFFGFCSSLWKKQQSDRPNLKYISFQLENSNLFTCFV